MGSRGPTAKLNEKHIKALDLFRSGKDLKETAAAVGLSVQHLKDLREGDNKAGAVGKLFKAEIDKIRKDLDRRIDENLKGNKDLAMKLMKRVLLEFSARPVLAEEEQKLVATYTNALGKLTPVGPKNVGISYNFTNFSSQELLYEYERLRGLAEGTSNTRTVWKAETSGPGTLSGLDGEGDTSSEEPEDS